MELHYKILGHGEPLVILHGLFGTSDNWAGLARQYAEHHTVVLVDLRNHGRSPHHPEMSYPHMAEDVVRLLEREWIHRINLIGHSMGGKVAMHMALEHPDLVDRLMVVDIGVKAYPGGHETIFEALRRLPIAEIRSRSEAEESLRQWIPEDDIVQFLLKNLAREGDGFRWKMNLEAIALHYPRILEAVEARDSFDKPTRFLRGGHSRYIEDADWSGIREIFPNSELITIPQSGHWVHAEQPQAFLQESLRFFSGDGNMDGQDRQDGNMDGQDRQDGNMDGQDRQDGNMDRQDRQDGNMDG
jgi:esterase